MANDIVSNPIGALIISFIPIGKYLSDGIISFKIPIHKILRLFLYSVYIIIKKCTFPCETQGFGILSTISYPKVKIMPENAEFLPFHAINEFMRPDFRLAVVRETLTSQSNLPKALSDELDEKIKKRVTVPGFRSSDKAPALMKVLPTSKAFEKNPDIVAVILTCWVELQLELRDQVYQLLKTLNWKFIDESEGFNIENFSIELIKEWPIFPISLNRTKLPGFYTHWPKGEDFDLLYNKYSELFSEAKYSIDKVSLMAVWLSMRLPYNVDDLLEKPEE